MEKDAVLGHIITVIIYSYCEVIQIYLAILHLIQSCSYLVFVIISHLSSFKIWRKRDTLTRICGLILSRGGGEHLPPFALACLLRNFVLTVNQFKRFKSLTVTLFIIKFNVNNSAHVLHAIMMFIVRDDF